VVVELIAGLIRSLPVVFGWISPDSAGAVDGLNLYVYVDNNPLKYRDPTGHFPTISWNKFVNSVISAGVKCGYSFRIFLPSFFEPYLARIVFGFFSGLLYASTTTDSFIKF
jgi:hypothetical protein